MCVGEGNMKLHCCVAAYVSDYAFLGTALLPYPNYRAKFSASLDHAMWFHSTFRSDEWMLYECESPWAGPCLSPPPRVKIPPVCVTKQSFGCIIHGRGGLMRCPCCVPQGEAEGWFKGACGGETERWQPPVLRRESSEWNLWQSPASYKHIPEIVLICIFLITCISLNLWKCNILNVPSLNSIYFKMFLLKKKQLMIYIWCSYAVGGHVLENSVGLSSCQGWSYWSDWSTATSAANGGNPENRIKTAPHSSTSQQWSGWRLHYP